MARLIRLVDLSAKPAATSYQRAFSVLENDIYDLRRAARIALSQLEDAIDDLPMGNKYDQFELAIFTATQVLRMSTALEETWLRLHNENAVAV